MTMPVSIGKSSSSSVLYCIYLLSHIIFYYCYRLDYDVRSALRKLQFAGNPNPTTYLTMFRGLPQNYRKSTLGEVSNETDHRLPGRYYDDDVH
jgi:hypothetical protein